jgi:hypothetical protein
MVPALAVGFDDVRKRMESQYRQCALYKSRLEVIIHSLKLLLYYDFNPFIQFMTGYDGEIRTITAKTYFGDADSIS